MSSGPLETQVMLCYTLRMTGSYIISKLKMECLKCPTRCYFLIKFAS